MTTHATFWKCGTVVRRLIEAFSPSKKFLTLPESARYELSEIVNSAIFLYGNMQTQMMLGAGLPKIVATSIKQAMKPKGLADREWMLKAGKILPIPKGAQIAIQNNLSEAKESPQLSDGGHEWKYPEDRLKEIVSITNPKQLAANNPAPGDSFHLSHNKTTVFER